MNIDRKCFAYRGVFIGQGVMNTGEWQRSVNYSDKPKLYKCFRFKCPVSGKLAKARTKRDALKMIDSLLDIGFVRMSQDAPRFRPRTLKSGSVSITEAMAVKGLIGLLERETHKDEKLVWYLARLGYAKSSLPLGHTA